MRTFDVFHHPEDGYEAVKHGFSWPAFLFGWIWAVVKDLNFAVFGLFAGVAGFFFLNYRLQQSNDAVLALLSSVAQLAFLIWTGLNGNKWRRANLLKRGFNLVGTTTASSPKRAIGQFAAPAIANVADA